MDLLHGPAESAPAEPADCDHCAAGPDLPRHLRLFSGEFVWSQEDLRIPGVGIDFAWIRTYRSRFGPTTSLGARWQHSYDLRVEKTEDGVSVWNGAGRADLYRPVAAGTYESYGIFATGRMDDGGRFTIRFSGGGTWEFFALGEGARGGRVARIADRNENALGFDYDGTGRLAAITDTVGRKIALRYDRAGLLASVIDFTGRTLRYQYYVAGEAGGSPGDLKSVTYPKVEATPTANDFPNGATARYTYSTARSQELRHQLLTASNRSGQPAVALAYYGEGIPDLAGRVRELRWGPAAHPLHITFDKGDAGVLAVTNDGNGNVREYEFDAAQRCVLIREFTARADPSKPTTRTENRPSVPVRPDEPAVFERTFAYDEVTGLVTQISWPDGRSTEQTYEGASRPDAPPEERGRLVAVTLRPGSAGADQPELSRRYEYLRGYGCTCGQAFTTRVTDARGNVVSTDYDDRGNAIRVVERDGGVTELAYDGAGRVIQRLHPTEFAGKRRRDVFEYGDRGAASADGPTTQVADADGLALRTVYEYDSLGRVVVQRDPEGNRHQSAWNQWDRLVRRTSPELEDQTRYQRDTIYDADGNAVQQLTRVVPADGRGGRVERRTTRRYDSMGRLVEVAEGIEQPVVVQYEYDANGNRVLIRRGEAVSGHQPANVVRLAFDARDLPYRRTHGDEHSGLTVVTFDYDTTGAVVRVVRGLGHEGSDTRFERDGYGRVRRVKEPTGALVNFGYDPNGNVVRQVVSPERDGYRLADVEQAFDAMDRTVRRSTAVMIGEEELGKLEETWGYDLLSRIVRHTAPGHGTRSYEYDGLGRAVRSESPGQTTTYGYDGNSNLTEEIVQTGGGETPPSTAKRYEHDRLGRVRRIAGPPGVTRKVTYDAADNLRCILLPGARRVDIDYRVPLRPIAVRWAGADGAEAVGVEQTWDDSARLTSRTDPNGNTTKFTYDAADNLVAVTYPDGTERAYSYDTRGNCTDQRDPTGTRIRSSYDRADRLVARQVEVGEGVSSDTRREEYAYDVLGRLVRADNDVSSVEWRYDSLSRPVEEIQDGRRVQVEHDDGRRGRVVAHPSGYRVTYEFDETSELRAISDATGPAVAFQAGGGEGEPTSATFLRTDGPVVRTVSFGDGGLLDTVATRRGEVVLDARRYLWDEIGNVVGVDHTHGAATRQIRYEIDAFGRLRRSTARPEGGETEYALDPAGNRVEVRGPSGAGRYEMGPGDAENNRYTTTPGESRTYDANGNLIAVRDERGATRSMRYDFRDRMVEYVDATGALTRYTYDCLGRRLGKRTSGPKGEDLGGERYSYDGELVVEIEDLAGRTRRNLLHRGRMLIGEVTVPGSSERWYVTDGLSSVVGSFDARDMLFRFDYDDYGTPNAVKNGIEVASSTLPLPPPAQLYAGYAYDPESALYYVRNRYLEPRVGRYTTCDPAGTWEDGRARGNPYVYAANNPTTFVDPSGLSVLTTYNCNGPWPGPRAIQVEYEDCSKSRRQMLVTPVCRAFRGSGQATERMLSLWLNDFTGVAQAGAGTTRARVKKWFGGPDNATSTYSKSVIATTLGEVSSAIKSDDFDIDCEGGGGTCASANAYVAWGGYDVNLCDNFFGSGFSFSKQASILIHELTHAYDDTDDFFYYPNDGSNAPFNALFETPTLRENADTYEQFTLEFYLP